MYERGQNAFVPIGPTLDKLRLLHDVGHYQLKEIALSSGITYGKVYSWYRQGIPGARVLHRVRRSDAALLAAYSPPVLSDEERRLGASRMLQGLMAKGFTTWVVAEHMNGIGGSAVENWRAASSSAHHRPPTPARYRELVQLCYKLETVNPKHLGIDPQVVLANRVKGELYGHAPIGAWDLEDIHRPTAAPDWTGVCGTMEGFRMHRLWREKNGSKIPVCLACNAARRADRAVSDGKYYAKSSPESIKRYLDDGMTLDAIAAELGCTVRTLRRKLGLESPHIMMDREKAVQVREKIAAGALQKDLAEEFGVSRSTITDIASGRTWKE
jgi:ribosome-binding protein aMBF1 (putative translation factor)